MISIVKFLWSALLTACLLPLCLVHPESREPLWRFITGGRIRSFPAVGRDGNVYVLSDDRFLYSLTPAGESRWRYYLEERLTDSFAAGYDGMIYIGYKTGELIAVHGYGQKVWQYDTGETIRLSPAVRRDGAVCLATEQGTLLAVTHTGVLLWKLSLPGTPTSSPVADADNSLYITLQNGDLVAVHPWGEVNWRLRLTGRPTYPSIGADGTVYVGTDTGALYAVDPLPKIIWRRSYRGGLLPAVIGRGGVLYLTTTGRELIAVSPDGQALWSLSLGAVPSGPCVLGETGTIFVATMDSTLYAVDLLGRIVWNMRAKGVLTHLMLSPQGILYAGSSDWAVYAFPGEKLAAAPWPAFRHDVSHTGASSRDFDERSIERRYAQDPDFIYFQSLFLSGDADLMQKGLDDIHLLVAEGRLREKRPFVLHLLRRVAGFTVLEEDNTVRFPLKGFSAIRQESCLLYTEIGDLEARPLLLRILKNDPDYTMKAVAVRCLARLGSDPDGEATQIMARLIQTARNKAPDNTFARETVSALKTFARYHGALGRDGVQTLMLIRSRGGNTEVRTAAQEALRDLAREK